MYEEEIQFGKLLLKQSELVLEHLTPVTKFEDGRSRRSLVNHWKRVKYILPR